MINELPAPDESAKADFAGFRAEEFIPTANYPAIILAAGLSRRMGQTKAFLPLGGKAMIQRIIDTCTESGCIGSIVVVTGHEASKVEEALADRSINFVHNSNYSSGEMLSSVQAGVRELSAECAAFYLLPCDQPLVQSSTFVALAAAFRDTASLVAIPVYQSKRGHPVLISSFVIPDILGLGARDTLKTALVRHRDRSVEVNVQDPGILFDVDTPDDYERAIRSEDVPVLNRVEPALTNT